MKEIYGVFASDEEWKDDFGKAKHLDAGTLCFALFSDKEGCPFNIEHDKLRMIGWAQNKALVIEPGIARLVGYSELFESESEERDMVKRLTDSVDKRNSRHIQEFTELKERLETWLDGTEIYRSFEAVSLLKKDLAVNVFPEIFEKIDDYGLVYLKDLEPVDLGVFSIDGLIFFAHQYFRRSFYRENNLNVPFINRLQRTKLDTVKIRLDPDLVGLQSSYRRPTELAYWWGPKFTDDISTIPSGITRHSANINEKQSRSLIFTDFSWHHSKDASIFETEEVYEPDYPIPSSALFGCRYCHSILSSEDSMHLDGAVRAYSQDELIERATIDLGRASKKTLYTKLWRVDGELLVSEWKSLVTDYFRNNMMVGEYLGGIDDELERRKEEKILKTKDRSEEDYDCFRIIISVSCNSIETCNNSIYSVNQTPPPYLLKEFKDMERLDITPETAEEENYAKYPLLVIGKFATDDILNRLNKNILKEYKNQRDNVGERMKYQLILPVDEDFIRIEIDGQLEDLIAYLDNKISSIPRKKEDFITWCSDVSKFVRNSFDCKGYSPITKRIAKFGRS